MLAARGGRRRTIAVTLLAGACYGACGPRERIVAFEQRPGEGADASLPPVPTLDGSVTPDATAEGRQDAAPALPFSTFGTPVLVGGLLDPTDLIQDPALSSDELEIYFASLKGGTYDIWTSTRSARDQPWSPATLVQSLSTPYADFEPDLGGDDLTMYLASDRPGTDFGTFLWVAQRTNRLAPWGVPQPLRLGTATSDRGPAVDARGLALVFYSDRGSGDLDLYLASRASTIAPWEAPVPLREINSSVFDWDPSLFRSGQGLIFGSRRDGDKTTSDLFEAARTDDFSPFLPPRALTELNSTGSEGDPWVSDDGHHIVFSSDRGGTVRLYEAWR